MFDGLPGGRFWCDTDRDQRPPELESYSWIKIKEELMAICPNSKDVIYKIIKESKGELKQTEILKEWNQNVTWKNLLL